MKDNDINLQYFCNYILVVYKVSHIETYTLRTEKRLIHFSPFHLVAFFFFFSFSFSFLFFFLHSFKLELERITGKRHNKNFIQRSPGFPFGSTVGGNILAEMDKNCMKITKSLGLKQLKGHGRQVNFLTHGEILPQFPPIPILGETLDNTQQNAV